MWSAPPPPPHNGFSKWVIYLGFTRGFNIYLDDIVPRLLYPSSYAPGLSFKINIQCSYLTDEKTISVINAAFHELKTLTCVRFKEAGAEDTDFLLFTGER